MVRIPVTIRTKLRKINSNAGIWPAAGFLATRLINAWFGTLSYRVWRYDPSADAADEAYGGPVIYVFWHEYLPTPMFLRPRCRLAILLSQHQDADILMHMARYAGLNAVRGSTNRGGTTALREMIAKGQGMSLAISPDGPRGPRRQLAQGCVYVSSRLQIPVVPIGIGYDRPWRNRRSWDQFAVPRPFSAARCVLGPRIQVPENLDRDEIEQHRLWIQQQLSELTVLAEDWAERRCDLPGSEPLYPAGHASVRAVGERAREAAAESLSHQAPFTGIA